MATTPRSMMDPAALDAVDAGCPARRLLGRLAERWTGLVLVVLADGRERRFSEVAREIGNISPKMLSQTLRGLERDGLVERRANGGPGGRPVYRVSPLGAEMMEPLGALSGWAYANREALDQAREQYDAAPRSEAPAPGA